MTDREAAQYLAAMIDGEGHVSSAERTYLRVQITNTDLDIVHSIEECLSQLGITYRSKMRESRHVNWKPTIDVLIYGRENFQKLQDLVPLRSERKRQALSEILSNYRPTPSDKAEVHGDFIRKMYDEGYGGTSIAKELGVDKGVVYNMMAAMGLRKRTMSEAAVLRCARSRDAA